MTGFVQVSVFLVVVAVLGGASFLATRFLPDGHPFRVRLDSLDEWISQNPRSFEKRLRQVAFGLVILAFSLITIICS